MKPRVGLLLGDPCGVGPELVAKLLSQPDVVSRANIILIGDRQVYKRGEEIAGVSNPVRVVAHIDEVKFDDDRPVLVNSPGLELSEAPLGQVSLSAGRYVLECLTLAVQYAQAGQIEAFCYASLNKQAMHLAGNPFPDELHFMADKLGLAGPFRELNIVGNLWTSRLSSHVPLAEAARYVTRENVLEIIELTHRTMQQAGIARPRLVVSALNPHAGDGGLIGREEIEVIKPAVEQAQERNIRVEGPFPPDVVFPLARDGAYDGVVTMYHDQGQIALKLLSNDFAVTVHGGLPLPVTTPAHGTAFDIVGQGLARVEALRHSFLTSCTMAQYLSNNGAG